VAAQSLSVGYPVKLLLIFASTVIPGFIALKIIAQDMYMFWNGASSLRKEGLFFRVDADVDVHCTVVSAWVYLCCGTVYATMNSTSPLSLHCTK
jgi:hypothetical protein